MSHNVCRERKLMRKMSKNHYFSTKFWQNKLTAMNVRFIKNILKNSISRSNCRFPEISMIWCRSYVPNIFFWYYIVRHVIRKTIFFWSFWAITRWNLTSESKNTTENVKKTTTFFWLFKNSLIFRPKTYFFYRLTSG